MNRSIFDNHRLLRPLRSIYNRFAILVWGIVLITAIGCEPQCVQYSCYVSTNDEMDFEVQIGSSSDSAFVPPFSNDAVDLLTCQPTLFDTVSFLRIYNSDPEAFPEEVLVSLRDDGGEEEGGLDFFTGGPATFDGITLELGKQLYSTDSKLSIVTLNSSEDLTPVFLIPRSFEQLPAVLQESSEVDSRDGTFGRTHFAQYFELGDRCFTTTRQGAWIFDVYRFDPDLIGVETSPETFESHLLASCQVNLVDGVTLDWDGESLNCRPGTRLSIPMVNNDSQGRPLFFSVDGTDGELRFPGDTWIYETWLGKVTLDISVVDIETGVLGRCILSNPREGDSIVWDGTNLICDPDDDPVEFATVSVCNGDYEFAVLPVIFTVDGPTNGVTVQVDDCLDFDVPTGAPVSFQVFSADATTLLGECILQSPSDGDQIYWDGLEASCAEN